jgi:hypothetical protein
MTQMLLHHVWGPPLLVLIWLLRCKLSARVGGWESLVRRFGRAGAPALPPGDSRFRFASGFFATSKWLPMGFTHCLDVSVQPEGIRFSVWKPWGFFHAPFILPWEAISEVRKERYWLVPHTRLTVRGEKTFIRVSTKPGRVILDACGQHQPAALLPDAPAA